MGRTPDRRYRRTEQRLQTALLSLIRTRGFQSLTVQDIADEAGVARKTFYAHHADKHELLWVSLEGVFDAITESLTHLDPDTLLVEGKPLSYPVYKHMAEYHVFYREMLHEAGTTAFLLRLWDYIAQVSYNKHSPLRQMAKEVLVPPPHLAQMLSGALLGSMRWWLEQESPPTPEAMAYTFSQVMAPGVLNVLGLEWG
ncbi:MAG: TetR/AcrR family transcriptional regulator [Anaerolineae bacterium]